METSVSYRIASAFFIFMPRPKIIEPGTKFGKLTFLRWIPNTMPRKALYKCDCGREKVIIATNVTTGRTVSCGCVAVLCESLPIKQGDVFGFWTVLGDGEEKISKGGHIRRTKKCQCICGKVKDVDINSLRDKTSRSCGCMNHFFQKPKPHQGKPLIVHGYRVIYKPDHKYATKWVCGPGFVFEHRYVMECFLGRSLRADEHVHHKDGNKLNNSLDNLEVLSREDHARLHHPKTRKKRDKKICPHWYDGLSKEYVETLLSKNSYEAIGRMFGVTGNAIKKKAAKMGIQIEKRTSREYMIASGRMREIMKNFAPNHGAIPPNAQPIMRISKDGERILYSSVKRAEVDGFSARSIFRHLKSGKPYKDFTWKLQLPSSTIG